MKVLNSFIKQTNDALYSIDSEKQLLERQLSKLDPEAMTFANKIANIVRDVPVIDFIDPYYEVKQVVVNDLEDDLVYMGMPKVDRCITCHVGIDKKGYEDAPQPYTTHPRLDEFVGGSSPHPSMDYGCTSCHAGRGRGTDFTSAGHMPKNEEQAKLWKKKYNWEALHYWGNKMLPTQYTEAGCFKCHSDNMPIKGAETLSLGMSTFEKAGCYTCHSMDRWGEEYPKAGPSLYKVASKTTKDWTYRWIMEPRAFRHNTWMPHFFKKGNNSSPEDLLRTEQETLAMTEYLFESSSDYDIYLSLPFPFSKKFTNLREIVEFIESDLKVILFFIELGSWVIGKIKFKQVLASKRGSRYVKGRHKAGGQSQRRFERNREKWIEEHYKKFVIDINDFFDNNNDIPFCYLAFGEEKVLNDLFKFNFLNKEKFLKRKSSLKNYNSKTLIKASTNIWSSRLYIDTKNAIVKKS